MRKLLVVLALLGAGCASKAVKPGAERAPNQVAADHAHSEEFLAHEVELRQHSFLIPDAKGHFGYHITQFKSPHQHQLIVRAETVIPGKNVQKLLSQTPKNGHWSVTTNKEPSYEKFRLREIFEGNRRNLIATRYDGLIISRPQIAKEKNVQFNIQKILYNSPMIAEDVKPEDAAFIVFGSYDKPKKNYFFAHLIKGANNYEQVLAVTFEQDVTIPNGAILVIDSPDQQPVPVGASYIGQIAGLGDLKFTIDKQFYYDERTLE